MSEGPASGEGHQHGRASELDQRKQGLNNWVEHRVIGGNKDADIDTTDGFAGFSTRERADLLYNKLMAYTVTDRMMREDKKENPDVDPEPVDPYLISEIKDLWGDEDTQQMFVSRFAEARLDAKAQRQSELGGKWQDINERIADTREAYEAGVRQLFLKQLKRPDQISAAQGRSQRFAKELIKLHDQKDAVVHLEGLPHTAENTDIAAGIMHDTLVKYHEQARQGFVWLPSREKIHEQTIASLQNGRWPVLRGEGGTGKSEQADAAAVAITGEQPTHLAAGINTSYRELVADRDIDPATGGGYEIYGAPMQAATGYEDSRSEKPKYTVGRVFRLDESGRMGPKGYSEVKELRQKKSATPEDIKKWEDGQSIDAGKLLHGKPVLPGFAAILTTNPEGPRYPDRNEPDPAMRRELSYINVDYPEMTTDNPELYEFMLATLMDDNNHIPVAERELAPAFRKDHPQGKRLPDGRKVISEEKLVDNPTYREHGSLYRLAFAVRSLQDAFNQGNMTDIPDNALRYDIDSEGKMKVVETGGDPLTLSTSTITLGEVASWMKGFHERRLKDDPAYQTETLTEWLQVKLRGYLKQVDDDDREKVQAILEHYHLFDAPPDMKDAKPITPKEIGYLSPRVPRPVEAASNAVSGENEATSNVAPKTAESKLSDDRDVMLEDPAGQMVRAKLKPLEYEKDGRKIRLVDGRGFFIGDDKFRFVGFKDDDHVVVMIDTGHKGEELHKIMTVEQLQEEAEYKIFAELEEREREYWSHKLGAQVEVPDLSSDLDQGALERLSEDPENMGIRALPKLDIGTFSDLKTYGIELFLERIQQKYPGLRRYESLTPAEQQDHSVWRLPEKSYWQKVIDGKSDFPEEYNTGGWLAVELMPKPNQGTPYEGTMISDELGQVDRFNTNWPTAHQAIENNRAAVLAKLDLPSDRGARMLKTAEFNLLANREGWGQTNSYEWLEDEFSGSGRSSRLVAGYSVLGGAANVYWRNPAYGHSDIGWRAAVVLGS